LKLIVTSPKDKVQKRKMNQDALKNKDYPDWFKQQITQNWAKKHQLKVKIKSLLMEILCFHTQTHWNYY